ncbi:protein FAR-RED ELONGATED HYPOCOTYL 3-like [Chenopodium quinoa]|uniref:protein FAR-RED ELONGATED HYPOCOTYL 3-like n=1 Tax=Chenopodium quinoa TaxID=63459 RepID=UPI000B79873E|nr:protein FAR-RED ELONGATED HYPOCOTYL 3-like [Chenopodium quinoa]
MEKSSIQSIEIDLNRNIQDTIENFDINVINFDLNDEAQIESNYDESLYHHPIQFELEQEDDAVEDVEQAIIEAEDENEVQEENQHVMEAQGHMLMGMLDCQGIRRRWFPAMSRVRLDADGRVCNLFWRDSMMLEDYKIYGDVTVFDTAYRTNCYNLICAPFVGINNHWKNTMFACSFIGDETIESFVWLFETFKKVMGGKSPVSLFTDQDAAMAAAIPKVFPNTKHRLCLWHLIQSVVTRFGVLWSDDTFKDAFTKCLSGCIYKAQFEESCRHKEVRAQIMQWDSKQTRRQLSNFALLKHAAEVYTHTLFSDFEEEFNLAIGSQTNLLLINGGKMVYQVYLEGRDGTTPAVTYDPANQTTQCPCKNFEESGWLCFHSLRILHMHSVEKIPEQYIFFRWTKMAKVEVWKSKEAKQKKKGTLNNFTPGRLHMVRKYYSLILKSHKFEQARKVLEESFLKDSSAIDEIISAMKSTNNHSENTTGVKENSEATSSSVVQVLDPARAKTKGKQSNKRIPGSYDYMKKGKRRKHREFGAKTPNINNKYML